MARHNFGHLVAVRTINPITGVYGHDIMVSFDGRMSQRTATDHLRERVTSDLSARKKALSAPYIPESYTVLGRSDYRDHPLPFSPSEYHTWEYATGWTINAYRPLGRSHDTPHTTLTAPTGKTYDVHLTTDKTQRGNTHTASIHDDQGKRVEFSGVNYDMALRGAIDRLDALISA